MLICSDSGCLSCPACKICPTKALVFIEEGEPVILRPSDCSLCGRCVPECRFGAISLGAGGEVGSEAGLEA